MSDRLARILAAYPVACRPTSPPTPLGNAGGFSGANLRRFDSPRGPLVLRAWPADGPGLGRLGLIHSWLLTLDDLGFIPTPIATLDGRTIVECDSLLHELARWMPGMADLSRPPPPAKLDATYAALARVHARLGSRAVIGPSPGLVARAEELVRGIGGGFDALAAALPRHGLDHRADLARRWLDQARRLAPRLVGPTGRAASIPLRLQPCLRDARPDHFLFDGDRLTGLVDFGAMDVDTVAGDLARLLPESVGTDRPGRARALAAYEAVRPLDRDEVAAIGLFEGSNALLGPGRWVRWHFVENRAFDDPKAVERGLARGLERIEQAGLKARSSGLMGPG